MPEQDKISIIIPIYNVEKYLGTCLDSALNQTCKNLEIIAVDDGSSDRSPEILRDYARKDPRIIAVFQENQGPGAARNLGLDRATGDYITFLDHDDWLAPDMCERLHSLITGAGADFAVCAHSCPAEDGGPGQEPDFSFFKGRAGRPVRLDDCPDLYIRTEIFPPWCKLYRAAFIRERGLKFPTDTLFDDVEFYAESCAEARTLALTDQRLVFHRQRSGAITGAAMHRNWGADGPRQHQAIQAAMLKKGRFAIYEKYYWPWALKAVDDALAATEEPMRREIYRNMRALVRQYPPSLDLLKKNFYLRQAMREYAPDDYRDSGLNPANSVKGNFFFTRLREPGRIRYKIFGVPALKITSRNRIYLLGLRVL